MNFPEKVFRRVNGTYKEIEREELCGLGIVFDPEDWALGSKTHYGIGELSRSFSTLSPSLESLPSVCMGTLL